MVKSDLTSESWQKNLYVIAIAEFVVIMGFSFVTPFMPLFIQRLGNFTTQEAALWAGIATGSGGIAMFLSAPVWGIVADRWGRKPMLLRAQFGSAIVLALAGMSPSIHLLHWPPYYARSAQWHGGRRLSPGGDNDSER